MILAVISYPYHYHITQLAIKHALANIDNITDVKVIWDDSTISSPTDNCIPFSQICSIPSYIKGWYAQQVIKLNLHNVLEGDVLILDGDVILNQKFNTIENFYAPAMGDRSKMFSKIKEFLHISQYNFINAPFMHVHTSWLQDLHLHYKDINQLYFDTAMSNWALDGEWPISEWEMLYNFLTFVKKINKPILPFEFKLLSTVKFEEELNLQDNFILNGKDNFSVDFYQKHNITINETLCKQIYGALV
jgi:hypothetical protein